MGHQRLFEEREFKFLTRQHPVVPKKKKPGRRAGDAERAIVASIVKGKTRDMRVDCLRQAYWLWWFSGPTEVLRKSSGLGGPGLQCDFALNAHLVAWFML